MQPSSVGSHCPNAQCHGRGGGNAMGELPLKHTTCHTTKSPTRSSLLYHRSAQACKPHYHHPEPDTNPSLLGLRPGCGTRPCKWVPNKELMTVAFLPPHTSSSRVFCSPERLQELLPSFSKLAKGSSCFLTEPNISTVIATIKVSTHPRHIQS